MDAKNKNSIKKAIKKTLKSLWQSVPMIFGVLLLIGIINSLLTKSVYDKTFGHGIFIDSIIGAFFGSISAGTPVNSYILGGEFLKNGVSLIAVTAFIVTWVSVGLIQLPVEAKFLGLKFAVWRNVSAFVLAIIIAILTSLIIKI